MGKDKSRYHTFLVYPESDSKPLPEDWIERLETIGVPIAISPLHDKDKSEKEEGGYKKAHYHGIYIANNPVTSDAVRKRVQAVLGEQVEKEDGELELAPYKGVALVQVVHQSVENVYKYLTHESKDAIAKKKHLYDRRDIVHINNFDIDRYIVADVEYKEKVLQSLVKIIRYRRIKNLPRLADVIDEIGLDYDLTYDIAEEVIKANTGYLRLWFDGNYQLEKEQIEKEIANFSLQKK